MTQAEKTIALQAQFICPIFVVFFGRTVLLFFTRYHAEQELRALTLNGTPCVGFDGKGNAI